LYCLRGVSFFGCAAILRFHVNRMPRNRLPRVMKHYFPTGRKNYGRPLKRLQDTWDRNGSTSDPTAWHIWRRRRWWWMIHIYIYIHIYILLMVIRRYSSPDNTQARFRTPISPNYFHKTHETGYSGLLISDVSKECTASVFKGRTPLQRKTNDLNHQHQHNARLDRRRLGRNGGVICDFWSWAENPANHWSNSRADTDLFLPHRKHKTCALQRLTV
jgi:hypothetical protein